LAHLSNVERIIRDDQDVLALFRAATVGQARRESVEQG
jgi:hypothetical protein